MKKKITWGVIVLLVIIIWGLYLGRDKENTRANLLTSVQKGEFVIPVTTTGELEAKNSEKIYGPNSIKLRSAAVWQLKIEHIIPDGTVVDSGEYVARLDASELGNKIKEQEIDLEKQRSQYIKTQLDTTLNLRTARNDLINLEFELEQKNIVVNQSIYEPPATQRQAKIDLDKAKRAYSQAVKNYKIKFSKAKAEMADVAASLKKSENVVENSKSLANEFNIVAPQAGMVIYQRSWDGSKKGIGATISTWDNVIATLPDLTKMLTKTYVNEIDISKVKKGQKVNIGIDAFPDKKLSGSVTSVANVGEELSGTDTKVFEVMIEINESDTTLRPAMTTKNEIITAIIPDALYIPLDALNFQDSTVFVYTNKKKKQEIVTGKSNDDYITVIGGLKENDKVYLLAPENAEKWKLNRIPTEKKKRLETKKAKE